MAPTPGRQLSGFIPLVLLAAAIVASFLASSGPVQWMDNGMFLADAAQGHLFSESLGPLSHPMYEFFITTVFRVSGSLGLSLINSVLLVPLVVLIYALARAVELSRPLAILAAVATVLAHSVFWVSTKSEVYVFHTLFVLAAYWLYLNKDLRLSPAARMFIIGILTGMGVAVHQLTFIVLLPLYVQMLVQFRARIWVTLPGFALGFAVALPAIIHDLQEGMNLFEIARRFLTGTSPIANEPAWESSMFRFDMIWHEKNMVTLMMLSFIGPQLLGLIFFPKTRPLQLLWAALIMNFIFAISYNVNDRFTFILPGVAMASILGILKLRSWLPDTTAGRALLNLSVLSSPVVLLSMWGAYSNGLVALPTHSESLPYRNDIHYFMVPYLADRSAEEFVQNYETLAPVGSIIIGDWTPMGALRSAQANGSLQGRTLSMCEDAKDIGIYMTGPGAFLARTSYCGNITDNFKLNKDLMGFRLQAK